MAGNINLGWYGMDIAMGISGQPALCLPDSSSQQVMAYNMRRSLWTADHQPDYEYWCLPRVCTPQLSRLYGYRRMEPDAWPARHRGHSPTLPILHGTTHHSGRQAHQSARRLLVVLIVHSSYPHHAKNWWRDPHVDEWSLRVRLHPLSLPPPCRDRCWQQGNGQTFHGCL